MNSWFRVSRTVFSNGIINHDSEYFIIWCYLLYSATYCPHQVLFNGKSIMLEKGQLITGRKRISLETNVNESKVQRVLAVFEQSGFIKQQTTTKARLITVLDPVFEENTEQQTTQPKNSRKTAEQQHTNTYNKGNKENKERMLYNYARAYDKKEKDSSDEPSYDLDLFMKKCINLKYIPPED